MVFIPKRHREWKPEHMRGVPKRRCHWCTSGPHRLGALIQVLESPMRYFFCEDVCLMRWQQHRHDADVVEWLKQGAGTRAKILRDYRNARQETTTEGGGSSSGVRGVAHMALPVCESGGLPSIALCSECGVSNSDHRE